MTFAYPPSKDSGTLKKLWCSLRESISSLNRTKFQNFTISFGMRRRGYVDQMISVRVRVSFRHRLHIRTRNSLCLEFATPMMPSGA